MTTHAYFWRYKREDGGDVHVRKSSDRTSMAICALSPRGRRVDDGHVKGAEGGEIQAGETKERKQAHKLGKQSGGASAVGLTGRRIGWFG